MRDNQNTMPFGRYKGEKLCEIPRHYRKWLLDEVELFATTRQQIEESLVAETCDDKEEEKERREALRWLNRELQPLPTATILLITDMVKDCFNKESGEKKK
jgi:hypothetical protein